jgi:2-polyprenyl-6-methoxyphenol hydroxylase-like FAD-dependent oxidoreductase
VEGAIAIHARTIETFDLMRGLGDFQAAGQRIVGARIYGNHGLIAQIELGSLDTRYNFILGVPQDETERILTEHVERHDVRIERNTELVGLTTHASSVTARLRSGDRVEEVEADWVLGCDGAHSAVQEQLTIPFSGSTYPEHFVLADLKVQGDLDPAFGQVWLHEAGALAFFPLPQDRYRLVVANSPGDWHNNPSLVQCQTLVGARGPGSIRLPDLRWSAVFQIHLREAARFRQDRVFLLGDAARIHSPIGGQGMNMGIQDAFNLAWKLSLVIRDAGDPKLLDSYDAERKPVDEAVIRQTDRATRLVSLHGTVPLHPRSPDVAGDPASHGRGAARRGIVGRRRQLPAQSDRRGARLQNGRPRGRRIGRPMRRSSKPMAPMAGRRCGFTTSLPSTARSCRCWATQRRGSPHCRPACPAIRTAFLRCTALRPLEARAGS